ncbi:MAG: radical SAM protein [Thermodesulfobacteriota bacterium]
MNSIHPERLPSLVYANDEGEIIDFPDLQMAGASAGEPCLPELVDLVPLPEGSELFVLPGRRPVGFDPGTGEMVHLEEDPNSPGRGARAVAAFVAPAHTAIYSAAYETTEGAPVLPLFAYTAVGWREGKFWAAVFRSDPDVRQDFSKFRQSRIDRKTREKLQEYPNNRLIQHLGKCCLTYGCPAARNYFLGRWEAPLPTSPACNARCVGCISLQESGCCPSTQDRIAFVPTVREITEVAVEHLENCERAIVSFGQGCEGEPLLQAKVIAEAIRAMRKATARGTINLNSNASLPGKVEELAGAGLDSIRVSMNSARDDKHGLYYRPQGFSLEQARESIRVMKRAGRFVSLNYFILPGFTDDPAETCALHALIEECRPDFIQLRNLNMDPEWYLATVAHQPAGKPLGIRAWLAGLKSAFPRLGFGYFNPPLR